MNGLTVIFDYTTPVRDLPGGLANSALVKVKGSTFDPATNTLTATDIEGKVRGLGDDMPKVHVEGMIANLTATTFSLNDQPVNYANASFRAGEEAELANGIKVEAEGPLVNGVVMAVRVTFKASVRIEAAVDAAWQRGTNENTNGLLQQYFPEGTDFRRVTDEALQTALYRLQPPPEEVPWLPDAP